MNILLFIICIGICISLSFIIGYFVLRYDLKKEIKKYNEISMENFKIIRDLTEINFKNTNDKI